MTSVNSQSSKALLKELLSSKKKASRSINENTPPLIESSSSGTNIPASSTQKQFFFHQQKEPNSTANNLPLLFEISGEIDYKKLQYSIENCVLAHRILRTGFQLIEDKVVQVIAEFPFVSIEKISCEQKPTYEILESYNTPFQVDNPPLFKVVFFENTKGSSYLFLTFHHLIADGLSFPNLIKHITATYTGHTIETANLQFEHFAIWEQCNKGHSYFIKQRKFWAEQQQKFSPIDFSQKHINSDSSSSNSKTHIFRLSNKLVQSLQEYAKKNTLSLYHICFAAYFILLQRLSNQIELTIGTAWSRRKNPALKSMIGPLLNTLAINLSFDISDTFQSVVERCKKAILLAQENGDYPFWDDLIDQGNEIYNTFFDFHYATINEIQLKDVRFVKQEIRNLDSKFPISLECYHNAEELKFEFEYSDQFFDKDFVVKISHQYCKILESFAEQSSITVFTQDLFTETDKKLLYERNYLANHKMIGIEDTFRPSFEKVVSKYSQHIALQDKYSFLTYKKLDEMVNRIAQHLLQLGLGSESRILLFMDRHKEFVIGALACFNLGMPYTPIDPSSIPTRLQSIIDELDPQLVLYHPLSIERLKNLDVSCKQLDIVQMLEAPIARNFAYPCIYPESLAYIIFTSGSTGKPKGVMVQHKGMLNHARAKIVELGLSNRDITAQTSIQTFDVSVWQIICPLLTGGVVSLFRGEEAWSPELLIPVLHQQQVTIFETVPSHMRVLLQYLESVDQQTFFRHLRILILNGEALPYNMCKQWISSYSDIPIVNAYGPTECSDDVTHQWVDDTNIDATLAYAPIGKILPGLAGFVLGHFQEQKPTGILGSLYIAGEGLARGYLDQPGLTASVFLPLPNHIPGKNPGERFYYTGDLVKQLDNGVYYYFGRNDHQVKINGQRIETGEIEKTILTIKGVRDCAIIPQKVSGRSVTLVAYLVLDKNISTLSTDIVKKEAQKLLPVNMVPRYWMSLDQIPITTNGKRNVKELPLPSDDGKTYPKHRAKTPIEQKIASAWEEVLGLDQFGINDDFFEVGGHSLLAAQLAMALSKRLNTSVPLKDIFQFSTIRELAKQYSAKNTEESSAFSEFALIQDKEQRYSPFPVTEVQQAYLLGRQQLYSLGDVSVHIYSEYERGNLDTKKFEESFNQLVQRHEALRIIFPDITTQTILASVPYYKFEIFSYDNEQEATPKLEELRATLSHEVFSADQWPLFKIKIVKFSNTYRIFLSFDALLMDGWSVDILFQEWITLYEKNTSLPPLQLSYRDYVLSMKAARKSKLYTKSRAFWLEKAQTFPSGPNLPIKVNPTQLREQKFQRVVKRIDSDAWGKIQNRIKKMKISPTAFVAELFSSILSSFGNSNHFALNLTLFDRVPIDPEINNICGDFTSLILLEHDYRENPTTAFDSNLLRTQDALWKSLDNRLFDGISFLRELNKNAKQTRFFPVVLTSILGIEDDQDRDIEKFFGKEIYSISQTPQVWLDFKAYEISGQLVVEWDYVKDLFENGFIEHMHGEFCSKIFELSNTADWSKLNTSLLSSSEKKARIDYNQTRASYPTCSLFELFEKQAAKTPNSIAAIDTKKQFTYSQLLDLCQLTIKKLLAQKVSPNQLVAVIIDKQVEQIAATLSIVGAGAAYLPIDPSFPGERIKTLLELGEVSCILTTSKIYNQIKYAHQSKKTSLN